MKQIVTRNYGCLAAEKRIIYTLGKREDAVATDEIVVDIPSEYNPFVSDAGYIIVEIGNAQYLFYELLCGNEVPCMVIPGTDKVIELEYKEFE